MYDASQHTTSYMHEPSLSSTYVLYHSTFAPVTYWPALYELTVQDVQLTVPMDSQRCVEKVKDALEIDGKSYQCEVVDDVKI